MCEFHAASAAAHWQSDEGLVTLFPKATKLKRLTLK